MTWYTFPPQSTIDVDGNRIADVSCQAYEVREGQTFGTPLAIRNPVSGVALSSIDITPLATSPAFQAERPYVFLKSADGPAIVVASVDGVLEQAAAAAAAAQQIRDDLPSLIEEAIGGTGEDDPTEAPTWHLIESPVEPTLPPNDARDGDLVVWVPTA